MPQYKDKLNSNGGLNKDVATENLPQGDYPDALDASFLSDFTGGSNNITPKIGNEYVFDTGSVSAQNKKYRLYIDLTATGTLSYQVTFYKSDTTTSFFSATFTNGSLAAADVAITNAAAAAGYSINIVNNGVFLLIEFAPMSGGVQTNYYDYYIDDTGTDELEDLYVYQEAIDLTLVGENHTIGSFDLLGDLFIWSTSQTELPSLHDGTITNIVHGSLITNVTITFSSAHGLNTGERILVQGVEGITGANGLWIVIASSATQIQLALSETVPIGTWTPGTGTITINPSGIGEIGVAVKTQVTQNWSYTRLLRSKEWNWNTKKQCDTYCEETATNRNLYSTNDYTPPLVFYYQTAYSQDGALSFNGGLYDYGTIFDETRLFLSVLNTQVEFTEQLQGGGALLAGNKRYAVRCLTETATATDWSDVTNPVNVFSASTTANPEKILGNVGGDPTAKVNVLTLSNIQADIFKYVEVAVIEYYGLSVSGYIINRFVITGSTMTVQHTGNEVPIQFDINEIQTFSIPIDTAKNIRAIDNRMILSNLTTIPDEDLSEVAQQVQHSVLRTTIDGVYFSTVDGVNYGEYQNPDNVNDFMGLMINDSYCFSMKFRYKVGGSWTKNFWVDVIKIDDSATNSANPFGDNRRIAGLPDLDLTTGLSTFVNYIQFTNVDFNYITSIGLRLADVFDAVSFERADCIPEILFTGITGISATTTSSGTPPGLFPRPQLHDTANMEDYNSMVNSSGTNIYPYRKTAVIYSPDVLLGGDGVNFTGNDKVINFGNPPAFYILPFGTYPSQGFIEFQGDNLDTPTTEDLTDAKMISVLQSASISGIQFINTGTGTGTPYAVGGELISTTNDLNTVNNFDYGYYYTQYYRPQANKYGDTLSELSQVQYGTCGNLYLTAGETTASTFDVYGGDTFTQKTYFEIFCNTNAGLTGIANTGLGFFSQNRINSQMRQKSDLATAKVFPADTAGTLPVDRVIDWLTNGVEFELLAYDDGYNIINGIDYHSSFDPNLIQNNDQPTRIRWSPVKPQNAIADLYRVFLPLDFHDLDNSFGEITHHENVNGELFTLQPKKWQRQFFNTRGTLQTVGAGSVLIGDGSVMSRDGVTISNYGCSNKWSVIKGKSQGGNDTLYWIDIINRQAIRFGADGTVGISTIKGLMSFLANNMTWCIANDTPADGEGICGVWNERYKEAIWTIRALRGYKGRLTDDDPEGTPELFNIATTYGFGSIVYYADGTPSDFNQTQVFYRSLHSNNLGNLPTVVSAWEQIPATDTDYFNQYSLCFNELKNRFTSFYTPLPKIYLQWTNTYLTPRPIATVSRHYLNNKGDYLSWYLEGSAELNTDGYVDVVYNKDSSLSKLFYAFIAVSGVVPYRVDFFTSQHQTTSLAADFKQYINEFATAIKNDALNTNPPPIGYSKLFGQWIICRFYFQNKQFNSLDGAVIKFTDINPSYQR